MILIAGLVFCSALFGFGGGVVAALIMLLYTLFFFSVDHSFVNFTTEGLQKVVVSLVGIVVDMLLVCNVKRAEMRAFRQVESLSQDLHRENQKLHDVSLTDGLTQIRNRTALQLDSDSYLDREVTVMMLDLNDFKNINDTSGHEEGDRILRETAQLLADSFGRTHCYRYGGDEFLVILPDVPTSAFLERLESVLEARPQVMLNKRVAQVSFSVGYVYAQPTNHEELRNLIAEADERMYEQKRDKHRARSRNPKQQQPSRTQTPTKPTAFTVQEMESYLKRMSGTYDLARMVDPIECRVLEIQSDGSVRRSKSCYGVWDSGHRCIDCSSALACRTGRQQHKAERIDDTVYHIESNPVTITMPDGTAYDAVVELGSVTNAAPDDRTNDRAAENVDQRAVQYRAHHDSLTGALNSDAFHELARERMAKDPYADWVMTTADIRNFRVVNSLFGVLKGNEVLVRTASLLGQIANDADGLCGRLGGDRFALLVRKESFEEQALRDVALDLAQGFSDGAYKLCVHFGVYHIEDTSLPVSVMCGRANSALYTIRESHTQTIAHFDDAIRQSILLEQRVVSEFDEALAGGEFQMYLQPLVQADGHVIGAEALARWHKPDGSLVMPGDFVETLERAGLIQQLDVHIWELAVKQLSAWKGTGLDELSISVNMSAKDFYSVDVYRVLTDLTRRYDVDCRKLRLEITESALLVEPDKSGAIVRKLRDKGFFVEIDDFGKGYSSLSILKSIQADVLKIDMGFLREISNSSRSRTILRSVIDMARSLRMDVICEGVETEQQLEALVSMGCGLFQGFLFSRPVPVAEFENTLASARP
jgi:diguanylate cyclase (GGDEF)-like protein